MTQVWIIEYTDPEGRTHIEAACATEEIAHHHALTAAQEVMTEAYGYGEGRAVHHSGGVDIVTSDDGNVFERWEIFPEYLLETLP